MFSQVEQLRRHRLPLYKTILCLICIVILLANGIGLFHNLQSLKGVNALLGQSARISNHLQYLDLLVLDAESSLRGYFISGLENYLGPMKTAQAEVENQFTELESLLADNVEQQKNLAQLHILVQRKMDFMQQGIEIYRHGGLNAILKIASLSTTRAAHDEIRLLVVIMEKEQSEMLAARNAAFYTEYENTLILGLGTNTVAMIVLLLFYRLAIRSFRAGMEVELALQNANDTLESMVARRTEQLSELSRHLINVREDEKASLARELHDEMGANLASINMTLAELERQLQNSAPELAEQLRCAKLILRETMQLKGRIVEDLRPSLLDNLGLRAALESYCEQFSRLAGLRCETVIDYDEQQDEPMLPIALFRIVQESLTNIMKYAQATHVCVSLKRSTSGVLLRIVDNGVGISNDALTKPMSHGILGMRERALLLGGGLTIARNKEGRGTCVEAHIPLQPVKPAPAPALSSAPHPAADGHIPSSPLCSIHQRNAPGQPDQSP